MHRAPDHPPPGGRRPPALRAPLADRVLAQHVHQGRSNDCGPCCAAMVINAVARFPVDAPALSRSLDRPAWRGPVPVLRRWPRSATFPWGLAAALRAQGVAAHWSLAAREDGLRDALRAGHLPIVALGGWRPLWGHWVVVLAWDPVRGWGTADPAARGGQMEWLAHHVFRQRRRRLGGLAVVARTARRQGTGAKG